MNYGRFFTSLCHHHCRTQMIKHWLYLLFCCYVSKFLFAFALHLYTCTIDALCCYVNKIIMLYYHFLNPLKSKPLSVTPNMLFLVLTFRKEQKRPRTKDWIRMGKYLKVLDLTLGIWPYFYLYATNATKWHPIFCFVIMQHCLMLLTVCSGYSKWMCWLFLVCYFSIPMCSYASIVQCILLFVLYWDISM